MRVGRRGVGSLRCEDPGPFRAGTERAKTAYDEVGNPTGVNYPDSPDLGYAWNATRQKPLKQRLMKANHE